MKKLLGYADVIIVPALTLAMTYYMAFEAKKHSALVTDRISFTFLLCLMTYMSWKIVQLMRKMADVLFKHSTLISAGLRTSKTFDEWRITIEPRLAQIEREQQIWPTMLGITVTGIGVVVAAGLALLALILRTR